MAQSVLILSFALAFSLLGAGIIADAASRKMRKLRILCACLLIAAILAVPYMIVALNIRFNYTPSMPLGMYRLVRVPSNAIRRGMLVATCAPLSAAALGRRRGYLATGPCPADTELLLKAVAGATGDEVTVSVTGVTVNGCLLRHSRPLSLDAGRRRLSFWPQGNYRLHRGQFWLFAPNDRSWDSRYWGPASAADISAIAIPVIAGPWTGVPRCAGNDVRLPDIVPDIW